MKMEQERGMLFPGWRTRGRLSNRTRPPLLSHVVLALVPLQTPETSGWDLHVHNTLLPSREWQG